MGIRPKPYSIVAPLSSEQIADIDEMFEILFSDLTNNAVFRDDLAIQVGDLLYGSAVNVLARLSIGAANTVLRSTGTLPTWGQVVLTSDVSGILPVANGGTAIASYTIGDLIYASAAGVLSKLADVAAGSYLRSGGVATAPLWSTLTLPNAASKGEVPYASAANVISMLGVGTAGQVLTTQGAGAVPTWTTPSAGGSGITGLLTNGDPTNPELIFDSFGDVITT